MRTFLLKFRYQKHSGVLGLKGFGAVFGRECMIHGTSWLQVKDVKAGMDFCVVTCVALQRCHQNEKPNMRMMIEFNVRTGII